MILKFHTFPPSMQNFSSDTLKNLREIPFLMLFNASPMFSQLKTSVALLKVVTMNSKNEILMVVKCAAIIVEVEAKNSEYKD